MSDRQTDKLSFSKVLTILWPLSNSSVKKNLGYWKSWFAPISLKTSMELFQKVFLGSETAPWKFKWYWCASEFTIARILHAWTITGVYVFHFAKKWVFGWLEKKYDDLLRKNANTWGKRWEKGGKEEIFTIIVWLSLHDPVCKLARRSGTGRHVCIVYSVMQSELLQRCRLGQF